MLKRSMFFFVFIETGLKILTLGTKKIILIIYFKKNDIDLIFYVLVLRLKTVHLICSFSVLTEKCFHILCTKETKIVYQNYLARLSPLNLFIYNEVTLTF